MDKKTAKALERHFKGAANHYRIAIILLLARYRELSLDEIAEFIKSSDKNTSAHTVRLVNSGLVNKYHRGRRVMHLLSPYGSRFADFIKSFTN